jgi:hypothetical protein
MKDFLKDVGPTIISARRLNCIYSRLSHSAPRCAVMRGFVPSIDRRSAISAVKDRPRWFHVYWSIENRSNHGYRAQSIKIKSPYFCYGLSASDAHIETKDSKPYDPKSEFKNPLPLELARRKIDLNFKLEKAGVIRHGPFPGATHWSSIYFRVPWWVVSRRFSMAVTLLSMEAEERESVLTVKRKIPAISSNKTA